MAVANCQLCTRPANSLSLVNPGLEGTCPSAQGKLFSKSVKHLWSYLYHQNVRETLSPSFSCATTAAVNEEGGACSLPKLAFTLYWGGDQNHHGNGQVGGGGGEQTVQLCWQCYEHIDKLDQLHQQLEQVKRLVEVQVKRIDNLCQSSGNWSKEGGNEFQKVASHSIFKTAKATGMSLAGVSTGKENIAQLIRFMATICEGIPASVTPASPETVENSETSRYFMGHSSVGNHHGNQKPVASAEQVNFHENSTVEDTYGRKYTVLRPPRSFGTDENAEVELVDVTVTVDPLSVEDDSNSMVSSNPSVEFRSASAILPSTSSTTSALTFTDEEDATTASGRRKRKRKRPENSFSSSGTCWPHVKQACPVCRKLIKKNHMKVHMRVHSGEKPFSCQLCDARFSQKSHLTTHQRLHTGETPYSCDVCFQSFDRRDKLKKHKFREHNMYT